MEKRRKEQNAVAVDLTFHADGTLRTVTLGNKADWGHIILTLLKYVPKGGTLITRARDDTTIQPIDGEVKPIPRVFNVSIVKNNLVLTAQQ